MDSIVLKSPAKINLYLDVFARRNDGYHNIETVFERISLYDDIILEKIPKGIELLCDKQELNNKDNLAYRAAEALLNTHYSIRHTKHAPGVRITIRKRIPIGAGLGGGSSNAASVLEGLSRLFDLRLARKQLLLLAKGIGADVGFFISNYTFAVGAGRGDCLREILFKNHKARLWHVLVCPNVSISTADAYRGLLTAKSNYSKIKQLPKGRRIQGILSALRTKDLQLLGRSLYNAFESYASARFPIISRAKTLLIEAGAIGASLSGSGSAVYGVVDSDTAAGSVSLFVSKKLRNCRVFVARTDD